jgi:hypothetical protein
MIDTACGCGKITLSRQTHSAAAVFYSSYAALTTAYSCAPSGLVVSAALVWRDSVTLRQGHLAFYGLDTMRKFSPRISLLLDRATVNDEAGSKFWRFVRRIIEGYIFL